MEQERNISVLIVDQSLEHKGLLANAAFVLGLTAGKELPKETFGEDVVDGDGKTHKYLTQIGHYVRRAGQSKIKTLRATLSELANITIVDYTEDAAPANYSEYSQNIAKHRSEEISYRALYVYGPESAVVPLTKNLSKL
jgi:hypothetical protein